MADLAQEKRCRNCGARLHFNDVRWVDHWGSSICHYAEDEAMRHQEAVTDTTPEEILRAMADGYVTSEAEQAAAATWALDRLKAGGKAARVSTRKALSHLPAYWHGTEDNDA